MKITFVTSEKKSTQEEVTYPIYAKNAPSHMEGFSTWCKRIDPLTTITILKRSWSNRTSYEISKDQVIQEEIWQREYYLGLDKFSSSEQEFNAAYQEAMNWMSEILK